MKQLHLILRTPDVLLSDLKRVLTSTCCVVHLAEGAVQAGCPLPCKALKTSVSNEAAPSKLKVHFTYTRKVGPKKRKSFHASELALQIWEDGRAEVLHDGHSLSVNRNKVAILEALHLYRTTASLRIHSAVHKRQFLCNNKACAKTHAFVIRWRRRGLPESSPQPLAELELQMSATSDHPGRIR